MAMTLDEILESGLLELYVLGQLSAEESQLVELAIEEYPSLKEEILAIEESLFRYDRVFKVDPPSGMLEKILSQINDAGGTTGNKIIKGLGPWIFLSSLLAISLIAAVLNFNTRINDLEQILGDQEVLLQDCEEEKEEQAQQLILRSELLDEESRKLIIAPTEKYPETRMIIHNNSSTQKNFLQINELPPLADNESFQLWSLNGDNPPVPLDVFENDTDQIIEIQFIENTQAYAITVEPRGGKDSPTLENLVGVFNVGS